MIFFENQSCTFLALINPYPTTVLIWGRQNHVVLHTFYLKNGRESDIKIKGFFEEEEISSKFGHPRTFLADLPLIWSSISTFDFFIIFEKFPWLKGLIRKLKYTKEAKNWPNLWILVIFNENNPILGKFGNFKWPINPLGHSVQRRGRKNHVVLQSVYLKNRR